MTEQDLMVLTPLLWVYPWEQGFAFRIVLQANNMAHRLRTIMNFQG